MKAHLPSHLTVVRDVLDRLSVFSIVLSIASRLHGLVMWLRIRCPCLTSNAGKERRT